MNSSNNLYIAVLLSLLLHVILLSLLWSQTTCPHTDIIQNISVVLVRGQEEPAKTAGYQLPRDKVQPRKSIPKPPHYHKKKQRFIKQSLPPIMAKKLKSPAKQRVVLHHFLKPPSPAANGKKMVAAKPTVSLRRGLAAAVSKNGKGMTKKNSGGKNRVPASPLYRINPPPSYPDLARRLGFSGVVLLKVLVDTSGSAANICLIHSSGHAILDRAAKKAVQHWRFRPGNINGAKLAMWVKVPIRFRLQ